MLALLKVAFGWLTGGTLDRILSSVDHKIDNETKREEVKAELVSEYMKAQVAIVTGRGWWFPLFFIAPLGLWFGSVCIYSILWCAACAYPQPWSVAALPRPLDEWAGIIIGSLFLAKSGEALIARLRK
jgi:hypothetical protein